MAVTGSRRDARRAGMSALNRQSAMVIAETMSEILPAHQHRHGRHEVDVARQRQDVEFLLREQSRKCQEIPERGAEQCDRQSLPEEDQRDPPPRCTHRRQDPDLPGLVQHHHQQRPDDVHGGHDDDEAEDDRDRLLLQFDPAEEVPVGLDRPCARNAG